MSNIDVVASFPEEGLIILEDAQGRFLMSKETDNLIPLQDETSPFIVQSDQHELIYLS